MLLPGFLLFATLLAVADKPDTIAQLEKVLDDAHAAHKSDAQMAGKINDFHFTERLTDSTLARLKAQYAGNAQTMMALELAADQSAFLPAPDAEITDRSVPESAQRQRMLQATVEYVAKTLASLPNFLATRTTKSYDDSLYALGRRGMPEAGPEERAPLHLVKTVSQEVSIRNDGADPSTEKNPKLRKQRKAGISSWGEFGALLAIILNDAGNGKVSWSHWEPTPTGQLAVFQFSVPMAASHYVVDDMHRTVKPAYHGSLWIDPASGAVLRVLIEVDEEAPKAGQAPAPRVATLVQYGPVTIEDRTFICPLRSLVIERIPAGRVAFGSAPTIWMNESVFTGYHRFASTSRIIIGDASQ